MKKDIEKVLLSEEEFKKIKAQLAEQLQRSIKIVFHSQLVF